MKIKTRWERYYDPGQRMTVLRRRYTKGQRARDGRAFAHRWSAKARKRRDELGALWRRREREAGK